MTENEIENNIQDKIKNLKNLSSIFELLCYFEFSLQTENSNLFIEKFNGKDRLSNEYSTGLIATLFHKDIFVKNLNIILEYYTKYKDLDSIPQGVIESAKITRLILDLCFYPLISRASIVSIKNMQYYGHAFYKEVRELEKALQFKFHIVDILTIFIELTFNAKFSYKEEPYPYKFNDKYFYEKLTKIRLVLGNYIVDFSSEILLRNSLNKLNSLKNKNPDEFYVISIFSELEKITSKYINWITIFSLKKSSAKNITENILNDLSRFRFYFDNRESQKLLNALSVLEEGLHKNISGTVGGKILNKIKNSTTDKERIIKIFNESYSVFNPDRDLFENQWANKSFINIIEFLSTLEIISPAIDNDWKIKTYIHKLYDCISQINENVNYFSVTDDIEKVWKDISSFENNLIEFKSTIGFPTKDHPITDRNMIVKSIVESVSKAIIAMANCDGGKIYIGIIEKIEDFTHPDLLSFLKKIRHIHIIDIYKTLELEKSSIDEKRLLIQQQLHTLTQHPIQKLDNLFNFEIYTIITDDREKISILCINVIKSKEKIYIRHKDGKNWITLPLRLNGRVELVDPSSGFYK